MKRMCFQLLIRRRAVVAALVFDVFLVGGALLLLAQSPPVAAVGLHQVQDLISSSQPGAAVDHTIVFYASNTIPALGQIVITPNAGDFTIPAGFDYTDVDFATAASSTGPYTDRTLSTTRSVVADGVSVVTGTNGSITITLSNSISAGTYMKIELGQQATYQQVGDQRIVNPTAIGSHRIYFTLYDAASSVLNTGGTIIAVIESVTTGAERELDNTPPVRSNGSPPSGNLPVGTVGVELSLNTDEQAICRYGTTPGVDYDSLPSGFRHSNDTLHTTSITGLSPGSYAYYVRCSDLPGNANPDDFVISFTIPATLPTPVPPGSPLFGPLPPAPPQPGVTFSGRAYPQASIAILKDGVIEQEVTADNQGRFTATMRTNQGTFTFGIIGEDREGRRSLTFNTTISLVSGSQSNVSNIFLSPTIELDTDVVDPGDPLVFRGESVPLSEIEGWVYPQNLSPVREISVSKATSTTADDGRYEVSYDTSQLGVDTYALKARAFDGALTSNFGQLLHFGLGTDPDVDFCTRADINEDTRVNLTDFSILLFNWNSTVATADINLDGRVNLTDFSVMLFCWTG